MASSPTPPVPFKDHCAIVHNNVLYVYSPDAFQTLDLKEGAQWRQESNGISVTGAVCVKGGIDGDKNKPALYVVGGRTNSTSSDYPGLQRYSIEEKVWKTITSVDPVLSQRRYHGAAYLNASSSLVVYGGSQTDDPRSSADTFRMEMFPPYRVLSSSGEGLPPLTNPQLHSWDEETAIMVGGSATNTGIYIFHPESKWQQPLGISLPEPLPDKSVAQTSLLVLDDLSKVLVTYRLGQLPNTVTRNVMRAGFDAQAVQGQTVGDPSSSVKSRFRLARRDVAIFNYPTYNGTEAPSTTRTNFAIGVGQRDRLAVVGGDAQNTVTFFDQLTNSWLPADTLLGAQKPLTSSSASPSTSAMATRSSVPTASTSAAAAGGTGPNTLAILGGILGGICGLAAIVILILLWLRQTRKKKAAAAEAQKASDSPFPAEAKGSFEGHFDQPLSFQGQPMGRSPVPSAVMEDRNNQHDSIAMFSGKIPESGPLKSHQHSGSSFSLGKNPFARAQSPSPLTISKPMMADLGDYRESAPGIELGKATPLTTAQEPAFPSLVVAGLDTPEDETRKDQRKTDEGWAAYFQADKDAPKEAGNESGKRDTTATDTSRQSSERAPPSRSGGGGFWPGAGVHHAVTKSPKVSIRNSEGATLMTNTVATANPTLQAGPVNPKTLTMSTAEGIPGKISRAESISTSATDDDDYEDDRMSAYSNEVPHNAHNSWTPFGGNASIQRPMSNNGQTLDFPLATSTSHDTSNSGTTKSTIPAFPMPATIRHVQPVYNSAVTDGGELLPPRAINPADYRTSEDYFGRAPTAPIQPPANAAQGTSDMSWINLGTPVQ